MKKKISIHYVCIILSLFFFSSAYGMKKTEEKAVQTDFSFLDQKEVIRILKKQIEFEKKLCEIDNKKEKEEKTKYRFELLSNLDEQNKKHEESKSIDQEKKDDPTVLLRRSILSLALMKNLNAQIEEHDGNEEEKDEKK